MALMRPSILYLLMNLLFLGSVLSPALAQEFNVVSQTRNIEGGSRGNIRVTFNQDVLDSEENLANITVSFYRRRQVRGCGFGGAFTRITRIVIGNRVILKPKGAARWRTSGFVVVTVPTNFQANDGSIFRGGPAGMTIGCADTNTYDGYTRLQE